MKNVLCASASGMVAETLTIPADTAKVRLQIQKVEPGQKARYSGLFGTIKTIAAEEGVIKLWDGIVPGLQR
jgi:solute carrier family 25 uncoupling protein 8/9